MATFNVDTSFQTEGSDKLREFLISNNKLKNVDSIYQKLIVKDIDYDELMQFGETDFRETMNELNIEKIQISRLFNALRIHKESRIYKQENVNLNNIKSQIVILSSEENKALSNMNDKCVQISETVSHITNKVNLLEGNTVKTQNIINQNFDHILKAVNDRRNELLLELNEKTNIEKEKLLREKDKLKLYQNEMNECNEKVQKLLKDSGLNNQNKKSTLLSITNKGSMCWRTH
eukprot:369301_1